MSTNNTSLQRNPGRPMSMEAGDRILDAAVALLGEKGWEGLSMEALAARAAVGKATIYRRWAAKEDIVIAAMERFVDDISIHDTGTFRTDLEALMNDAIRAYRTPRGKLIPALASVMERQPKLAKVVRRKFLEPRRRAVFAVFERARERGEIAPGADIDLIHDLLVGPILYRRLFTGMALDLKLVQGMVEAIMASFASPAGPTAQ